MLFCIMFVFDCSVMHYVTHCISYCQKIVVNHCSEDLEFARARCSYTQSKKKFMQSETSVHLQNFVILGRKERIRIGRKGKTRIGRKERMRVGRMKRRRNGIGEWQPSDWKAWSWEDWQKEQIKRKSAEEEHLKAFLFLIRIFRATMRP